MSDSVARRQRIAVVGTSCSGKTTFARRLAQHCRIQHVELDGLYWQPNWQPRPRDEFRELVDRVTAQPTWVTDGNYSSVRDLIWQRADTLIWLNYPFRTVFTRALGRTLKRSLTREKLFAGNQESLFRAFCSRQSILLWVLQTYGKHRREYPQLLARSEHAHLEVVELQRASDTESLLAAPS